MDDLDTEEQLAVDLAAFEEYQRQVKAEQDKRNAERRTRTALRRLG